MILRIGFAALAISLLVLQLVREWDAVRDTVLTLGVWPVVHSFAWAALGLTLSSFAWRECLAGLGSRLPIFAAERTFFLSQTGKYIPGTVATLVAQMELGKRFGVPRTRAVMAGLLFLALHLTTGLATAVVVIPFSSELMSSDYAWVSLLVIPLLVVLHPRILTRVINLGFRLIKRPPLERTLTWRTILVSCGALLAMWVAYGFSVAAFTAPLGGLDLRTILFAYGGFALAWSVGFVSIVFPAGMGPREAILVLALGPSIGVGAATAVAALVRLTHTLGDLTLAVAWGAVRVKIPGPADESLADAAEAANAASTAEAESAAEPADGVGQPLVEKLR